MALNTRTTQSMVLLLGASTLIARAGAAQGKCDPVPAEIVALAGPVYTGCEVNKKAAPPKPSSFPDFDLQSSYSGSCWRATIDVVIDTVDSALPQTARIVKTNDSAFARALIQHLPQMKFRVAEKDGQPVRQWLRFDYQKPRRFAVSRAGTAGMMPTERSNSC